MSSGVKNMVGDEIKEYRTDVRCVNCNGVVWFWIPKGIMAEKFFSDENNKICKICECLHGREK